MSTMRGSILVLLSACALCVTVDAGAALTRTGTPDVQFTATGPAGLKIVGTTHELDVRDDGTLVVVAVPLANLDTGISLRNRHMREKYLEVDKYPRAELTVARGVLQVPGAGAGTSTAGEADGTMVIHGVSKPVHFSYRAKRDGASLKVNGAVHLNINDYGIAVPSYLGVTVKPEIDVDLSFGVTE